ncbi:cytochrome b/b6 domain-containing protein [Arthrobacter sp. MYb227]|uniref:cytochrome b/b6 domain-containing protein n=1 Tax=Arthrobacter sp. MYb227 TaxID=1848601 RepID=UPI002157AB68|nr:cytochrome b/b6 domain-containing protein [Arthrobacter sp. MYb227]
MARQGLPRTSSAGTAGSETPAAQQLPTQETVPTSASVVTPETSVPAVATRRRGLPRPTDSGTATAGGLEPAKAPTAVETEPEKASASAPVAGRRGLPRTTGPAAEISQPTNAAGITALDVTVAGAAEPVTVIPRADTITAKGTSASPTTLVRETGALERLWHSRGGRAVIWAAGLLVVLAVVVFTARWLMTTESVQSFVTRYPGETELPHGAPVGLPGWLAWQHFFNIFLMVLIIRSGWQVRTQRRPPASWTARWGKNPKKISINLWLHQSLDILWLVNGALFVVLLMATGQWMRVVPTSWEVFPNALSAILQYASLDWPTENGWVNYNSLQVLAYFATIFIAAPLAALTGLRMSDAWPNKAQRLSKIYPVEVARAIHLPVMFYFVGFIIVHVALVLSTGALRNLNHMYGGQDAVNWYGFWIFFISLLVIVGGWFAARPLILAPIASLFGKVSR